MDANKLVNYIYENDEVENILNGLDCVHISSSGTEFRCGLPDDTSSNRVRIKNNEYLNITVFQSNDQIIRGNIITLTMKILNVKFVKAIKYLHRELGLKYSYKRKTQEELDMKSPMDIFNKMKGKKVFDPRDIPTYDSTALEEFVPNLHESWFREGIVSFTAREFGIGYDFKRKRIIIPHRLWCGESDDYIGIIGRTTIEDFELLNIPKYFPIISYPKGMNIYGLQENYKYIQEAGYATVFEAEKSVLKRHSRLDKTGLSIMCHDFDQGGEQVAILIGLNVEIIIVMDKGVSLNHVRYMCNKFYGVRKISYVWDKYNLVPNKESPADMDKKTYDYLIKHRVRFDEKERGEYYKWKKENREM